MRRMTSSLLVRHLQSGLGRLPPGPLVVAFSGGLDSTALLHALAGIGHPERFFAQLAAIGIVATPHRFRDHHRFVAADLDIVGAQAILMTEKDALKCETFADERCWYLPVEARIDEGLITLVEGKLRGFKAA